MPAHTGDKLLNSKLLLFRFAAIKAVLHCQ